MWPVCHCMSVWCTFVHLCVWICICVYNMCVLLCAIWPTWASTLAQRKRVGLITQRSLDRDQQVLSFCHDIHYHPKTHMLPYARTRQTTITTTQSNTHIPSLRITNTLLVMTLTQLFMFKVKLYLVTSTELAIKHLLLFLSSLRRKFGHWLGDLDFQIDFTYSRSMP